MSYAGPKGSNTRTATRPSSTSTDWEQLAVFGAGLAVGLAVGAGIALLAAPQPGWQTRSDISRFTRNKRRALQRRSRDAWLDLRDELREASRSLRRTRRPVSERPLPPSELRPDNDDR